MSEIVIPDKIKAKMDKLAEVASDFYRLQDEIEDEFLDKLLDVRKDESLSKDEIMGEMKDLTSLFSDKDSLMRRVIYTDPQGYSRDFRDIFGYHDFEARRTIRNIEKSS